MNFRLIRPSALPYICRTTTARWFILQKINEKCIHAFTKESVMHTWRLIQCWTNLAIDLNKRDRGSKHRGSDTQSLFCYKILMKLCMQSTHNWAGKNSNFVIFLFIFFFDFRVDQFCQKLYKLPIFSALPNIFRLVINSHNRPTFVFFGKSYVRSIIAFVYSQEAQTLISNRSNLANAVGIFPLTNWMWKQQIMDYFLVNETKNKTAFFVENI